MKKPGALPLSTVFPHAQPLNGKHGIYTMEASAIRDGLRELVQKKCMKCVTKTIGNHTLELYHYYQTFHAWTKIALCGRSSVFSIGDGGDVRVIIPGYEKFFELEQLDKEEVMGRYGTARFLATEKMDGEACHFTVMDDGTFVICSSESFSSEVVDVVGNTLKSTAIIDHLRPGYVYTVELVKSQIVCRYPQEKNGIYLVRVVTPDGVIVEYPTRCAMAKEMGMMVVPRCEFQTFREIVEYVESIRPGQKLTMEGYVVEFEDGFCLKLKTPLYYAMANDRCNMTEAKVFHCCLTGEVPPFTCESARDQFMADCEALSTKLTDLAGPIIAFVETHKHLTNDMELLAEAKKAGIKQTFFSFVKGRDTSPKAVKKMLFKPLYVK